MKGPVFIVGNSRSGTTMMMRIMDMHPQVHSINEPHFFDSMWSPEDEGKSLEKREAEQVLLKLFTGQRAGFFEKVEDHRRSYQAEVDSILGQWPSEKRLSRSELFSIFLFYETKKQGKSIPCEKTPQNIFYIPEILRLFPDARIVHMIRDPRGTMLSQKNKWKRRALGAHFMTKKEILRLRVNYHPITMSKLWVAAIRAGDSHSQLPEVLEVRFEDLLKDPELTAKMICAHAGIDFDPIMLQIPHAGSSLEADNSSELGIRQKKKKTWQEKGLSDVEIHLCQSICAAAMQHHSYEAVPVSPSFLGLAYSYISFPIKLMGALLLNLNRMRSLLDTLKRRLS